MHDEVSEKRGLFAKTIIAAVDAYILSGPAKAISIDTGDRPSLGKEVEIDEFIPHIANLQSLAVVIVGVCAICSLILFFVSITRLSTSAGNDMARRRAMKGVLFSGLALALFGGGNVIIGALWNMFD